jgi:hypothetical protein
MSGVTITPNMSLPNPVPGIEISPNWSYDIAACLTIVDSHNHSSGQGIPIQPNGLNINSDLPFGGNNATLLRTARFSPQASPITNASPDVGCLYVSGNELYYNDFSGGHQVQITTSGNVNAGAGSITGLPYGTASATFSSGTFVWQSSTSTAANMDAGSYIFRNSGASSYGLTLSAPTLGANSALTLPAVPGAQSFVTLDASGNFGTPVALSNGITASNIAAGTLTTTQISASAGILGTQIANATLTTTQISSTAGITPGQLGTPFTWSASKATATYTSTTTLFTSTGFSPISTRPVFVNFTNNTTSGDAGIIVPPGWLITFSIQFGLNVVSQVTIDTRLGSDYNAIPMSALNFSVAEAGSVPGHTFSFVLTIGASSSGNISITGFTMNLFQI